MFRKIISNLSFSPALVWQLGHYYKIVKKEEVTRRFGLVFIILSLIVQSLIVFQPPEPANASNTNDMVLGGVGTSINGFLSPYDSNTRQLKDIVDYIGITRNEIQSAKLGSWENTKKETWGLVPHFSFAEGERQFDINIINNKQPVTVYTRPSKLLNTPDDKSYGWVGNSTKIGWFGIVQNSGNLVTEKLPSPSSKGCNDLSCVPEITRSTTANNISQGFVDASTITAVASDQISYTITIGNTSNSPVTTPLNDNLSDILEYSILIDDGGGGGGILDESTRVLSWSDITLDPKSEQTRTFVVKILDEIPATAQGVSSPVSFDCKITNAFGNSIDTSIDCPAQKTVERVINSLPRIGLLGNIIFAIIILTLSIYLYLRSHQLKKEIRIIRKDTSTGTI